jgi:hypothetical protein
MYQAGVHCTFGDGHTQSRSALHGIDQRLAALPAAVSSVEFRNVREAEAIFVLLAAT